MFCITYHYTVPFVLFQQAGSHLQLISLPYQTQCNVFLKHRKIYMKWSAKRNLNIQTENSCKSMFYRGIKSQKKVYNFSIFFYSFRIFLQTFNSTSWSYVALLRVQKISKLIAKINKIQHKTNLSVRLYIWNRWSAYLHVWCGCQSSMRYTVKTKSKIIACTWIMIM